MTEAGSRGTHSMVPPGVWVDDSDEDDPVLRNADGTTVDTWREDYPYAERLSRDEYDHEKLGNGKLSPTPLTKAHIARWPVTP
jgi:hypothetical protein